MEALTALLETLTPAQREVVEKAKGELEKADAKIKRLEFEVEHQRLLILELRRSRHGAKGEKLSTLQQDLLNLEPGVSAKEVEIEAGQADPAISTEEPSAKSKEPAKKRYNKSHPGRGELPVHLSREERVLELLPRTHASGSQRASRTTPCPPPRAQRATASLHQRKARSRPGGGLAPPASWVRPVPTRLDNGQSSSASSTSVRWNWTLTGPKTQCAPLCSAAKTGSTSAAGQPVHASPPSLASSNPQSALASIQGTTSPMSFHAWPTAPLPKWLP